MAMHRDPTEFRARFKAYKEGKQPYENGLPKYEDGNESIDQTRLDARLLIEEAILLSQNTTFGRRKLSPESYYFRYRNSEGFRKRFDAGYGEAGAFYRLGLDLKKVPAIKYGDNEGSMYIPNQNLVYMGSNTNKDYANLGLHNRDFVKAHEQAHSIYNSNIFGENNSEMLGRPVEQYTKLNTPNLLNYRTWVNKNNDGNVDFSHDSSGTEGGADIGALGYLLYNDGVFNRMDPNAKITKKQLDDWYEIYKLKNPDNPYLRPLENYGTEKAAWLLNNTASVQKKSKPGLLHAADGKLPKYEDGRMAWYDQDKDLYYGGSLPEVTVTGEKRNHSAIDYLLWKADRAGAPSHITNAVRDFNNRVYNFPVIAADATARYIKGGYDNILQAYKAADVNPSKSLKKFLVYPYTNDENNYSKAELAAMRKLSDITGKGTGAIGYKAYRQVNNGRYAGDINFGDFNKPSKVIEWSLGQTERKNGDEPYLYDNFSYDTKDTKGVYLKGALKGNINPVMGLRSMFGLIGSKGYDDGTNSATSIKTRIPTRYLRK